MKAITVFATSWVRWASVVLVVALAGLAAISFHEWFPALRQFAASWWDGDSRLDARHIVGSEHAHVDDHEGHDEVNSVELSTQAQKNIDLKTARITLQRFERTISVPGLVVERPGRSQVDVTALVGGQVTRVYPIPGEAVVPNQALFDQRLTHEELVNAQSELLRAAEELDVIKREIERLTSVSIPGAVPGKTVREREYELQKHAAIINSQRQSLVLHGLSMEQVDEILKHRKLLQGVTVVAPPFPSNGHEHKADHPFHVHQLKVKPGEYVEAGASLCILADHHELYIEGRAFEQELEHLNRTIREGLPVTANVVSSSRQPELITGLKILYLSDSVDIAARMLPFYIRLPNQLIRDVTEDSGHRFVEWKYRPGQRMQVHVPIEIWNDRIVLPVSAIAQDGAETYVFERNGDHFDRVPVHVEYRDDRYVVIENDGRLLGSTVAVSGAQQLHLALKNKAGGAINPHAGHSH